MTTAEIYKHARENLMRIAREQSELLEEHIYRDDAVFYRCKLLATESKIDFLNKLLAVWEVTEDE